MAGFGWRKDRALIEQLFAESYRFDFFQAVRLLEAAASGATGVGEGVRAEQEAVNFSSSLGAAFPASEIDGIRPDSNPNEPPEMTVSFIGIAGAFGPLSRPLSEQILERARRHDTAGRDFLDIFNHRLASLYYRVRQRHRAALSCGGPEHSHFARHLFALIGLATKGLQGRLDDLPDRALLHYAGLLALMTRSLHAVDRIGAKANLSSGAGLRSAPAGGKNRLGAGFMLGSRFWDQSPAIRLDPGRLDLAIFRRFLSGAMPTGRCARCSVFSPAARPIARCICCSPPRRCRRCGCPLLAAESPGGPHGWPRGR